MKTLKKLLAKKNPPLADRMEELFKKLDKVGLEPASCFKTKAGKEHYESLLMFAFRKRESARYHRRRVDEISAAERIEAEKATHLSDNDPRLKLAEIKIAVSKSNNDYAHELAAFCAAIRSSMDFLAKLMAEHTKSVQVSSITSFMTWAVEGRSTPTVDVVAKHYKWLAHIRDYRDYLIHRLVVNTSSGFQRTFKHGKWTTTVYPVSVPANTPQHVPDTRRARMLDDMHARFDESRSSLVVTDEMETVIESETTIEFLPTEGQMRIEKMMDCELKAFEAFFSDVVEALIKLNFKLVPLPHPPKEGGPSAPQSPPRQA